MRNSYEVTEINNYVILNTWQNFYFREYSIFVYQFGLKKMPNLISAKYMRMILFWLQNMLILIGIL